MVRGSGNSRIFLANCRHTQKIGCPFGSRILFYTLEPRTMYLEPVPRTSY